MFVRFGGRIRVHTALGSTLLVADKDSRVGARADTDMALGAHRKPSSM